MDSFEIRHESVRAEGINLHVARAGSGPPVVLLHGFPEYWRSWRHQIPALVSAGFSVWAPDLRGYNLSDRPRERSAYELRHLIADIKAVVDAAGAGKAHIVGHDWGGILAWTFAGQHKEMTDKLVILNAPHFEIYMRKVKSPPQMFMSWYVGFFLLPNVPELALSANDFAVVRKMFRDKPTQKNAFSKSDIDDYIEMLARPGALTAALHFYRAGILSKQGMKLAREARIEADTLVIWGDHDPALSLVLLEGLERVAPRVQVHRISDASHWVQNEKPYEVNKVMIDFLRAEQLHV